MFYEDDQAWKAQASAFAGLLKDPDAGVRGMAALALGNLGVKEYIPDIAALFKDPDEGVICWATVGFAYLAGGEISSDEESYYAIRAWWEEHKNDPEFAPKR